jgi:hypothetical protein
MIHAHRAAPPRLAALRRDDLRSPAVLAALLALLSAATPPVPGALVAPAGGARAAAATRPLVGAPYLASPLGEGTGRDPDPRFRLDAFDCMTFVETAIALASASSAGEAALALDDVRYAGTPALAARNHEVLSQWIPANVARGWIAAVTRQLAGPLARSAEKTYDPSGWALVRAAGRAIPGLPRSRLPRGRFGVDVIAVADAPAVARRAPDGAVLFVVREDAPERATRVSHAGILVRGSRGALLVRHATSSRGVGRVIEEPLARFLRRQERAYPRWPVTGISFFAIRDNSARVRALTPIVRPVHGSASERPPDGASL